MRGLLLFEYGPFASFLRSTVSTELMKTFIKSISKYTNNGQKKKRKIKIDNFLRRITTRIFRYYTRLLLESRFHPNSDNLDNGLVNFFPNFSSKKKYDRRIWVKGNNQMYLVFYRECLQPLPG